MEETKHAQAKMLSGLTFSVFFLLFHLPISSATSPPSPPIVCIVGGGISGSSVAHFLRRYSPHTALTLRIFERSGVVGGRMATVVLAGETFEAGASILHPKNFHAVNFTKMLNLSVKTPPSSESSLSLGIWDGEKFVFKTLDSNSKSSIVQRIVAITNSVLLFVRYGFSLLKMDSFVQTTVDNFLKYYASFESRPVFETVDEMLKWADLYNLTARTLQDELVEAGLSPLLIEELVTVRTLTNFLSCFLN
ncbi:Farnesylcysteine lyase [Vitis vinifera]|uniref:Farnesylcysteine lyase n=1 Tax=Vitis vinifera TaxID=29760 RepID=A0A438KJX3_VITVI|nr:Farnesylcysteine lyase [Vitis vinifera]